MTPPTLGVLLAGGLARRMGGGDKPLKAIAGRTILARVMVFAPLSLWRSDMSALDIDVLEDLVALLRRTPKRVWEDAAARAPESLALR